EGHADYGVVQERQEEQRAQRRERQGLAAAGYGTIVAVPVTRDGLGLASQPRDPASAGRTAHGRGLAAILEGQQLAEADVADLPCPVLVHRRAGLVRQRRRPVEQDI